MSTSPKDSDELLIELRNMLEIKKRYTSLNVVIHEISTKLAQNYLEKKFPEIKGWYSNPRASSGFDIFGPTLTEPKVVAEVTAHEPILKTTGGKTRFGAQQKQRMRGTIDKLLSERQAKKYLFVVTDTAKMAVTEEFETSGIQVESLLNLFG